MKKNTVKPLPFRLDRSSADSLKNQLAEGLGEAIRTGYYRSGDVLPSLNKVAAELGVSEIVVRAAYRSLAADGQVVARPRIGSVVQPPKTPIWRGHILCVMTDYDFNFRICGTVGRLRERLTKNGFLFSQVIVVYGPNGRLDYTGFDFALMRPVDLIILVFGLEEIEQRLSAIGIPYVVVGGNGDVKPGCVERIRISSRRAISDFVRKCRLRNISEVEIVTCSRKADLAQAVTKALSDIGISIRSTRITVKEDERRAEAIERGGYDFVMQNHSKRAFRFPDMYFVADDYCAKGMLSAFLALGVEIPESVRFVCCSNGGFRPIYLKPVTVIECDPYTQGEEVSRRILGWLIERKPFPVSVVEAVYVEGKTFL